MGMQMIRQTLPSVLSFGQLIWVAVTSRLHHRNRLGSTSGRRASYRGFECDFCTEIPGNLGLWEN